MRELTSQAAVESDLAKPSDSRVKTTTNTALLKKVDTLIAFENYPQATALLNQLLDETPANPEYRLRLLHVLSAVGQTEAVVEQEEVLAAIMDGPLSDTLSRMRQVGSDLLPGHPLFAHFEEGLENSTDSLSDARSVDEHSPKT